MGGQLVDVDKRIALCDSHLHFRGDLVGKIEGQVLGPSDVGEWFVILLAEYDSAIDRTSAHCGYASPEELLAARGTTGRRT
jgi:hypothetical protein